MKNSTTHLLTALTALTLATGATALAKPAFEDVALGKAYLCMDSDTSSGVTYMFSDYEMTPGVFTNNGNAYIDNIGNACGYNKELALSNIYVTYDYAAGGAPVPTQPVVPAAGPGGPAPERETEGPAPPREGHQLRRGGR